MMVFELHDLMYFRIVHINMNFVVVCACTTLLEWTATIYISSFCICICFLYLEVSCCLSNEMLVPTIF